MVKSPALACSRGADDQPLSGTSCPRVPAGADSTQTFAAFTCGRQRAPLRCWSELTLVGRWECLLSANASRPPRAGKAGGWPRRTRADPARSLSGGSEGCLWRRYGASTVGGPLALNANDRAQAQQSSGLSGAARADRTLASKVSSLRAPHSHTTATLHPSALKAAAAAVSRLTFPASFGSQYSRLVLGFEASRQPACWCQKQP